MFVVELPGRYKVYAALCLVSARGERDSFGAQFVSWWLYANTRTHNNLRLHVNGQRRQNCKQNERIVRVSEFDIPLQQNQIANLFYR